MNLLEHFFEFLAFCKHYVLICKKREKGAPGGLASRHDAFEPGCGSFVEPVCPVQDAAIKTPANEKVLDRFFLFFFCSGTNKFCSFDLLPTKCLEIFRQRMRRK